VSKYPVIEVGDPWTADLANSMLADTTYKSTATPRTNNTLADDPDLVTPTLVANGVYLVEFSIRYATTAVATTGIKTAWNVPAGVLSTNKEVLGAGSTQTDGSADNDGGRFGVHGYATTIQYGTRGSASLQLRAYEASTVIMGATAGTVALQWAQVTTSATASVVSAGSYVKVTRTG